MGTTSGRTGRKIMNSTTLNTSSGRTAFLDNLRTLMVLLVLVFHSGASYGSAVEFWPFHDSNPSKVIDLLMFLLDIFMMSVLFFIAGYFTLPTLQKKGMWRFVKGKFKRLGIPWLVITLLVLPVLDYLHYWYDAIHRGGSIRGYGAHWLLSMKRVADFHVGWMDMSTYTNMTEQFYQRYMWYVSLLILFFIVFAVLYAVLKGMGRFSSHQVQKKYTTQSTRCALVITGLVTVLLFALIRFFLYADFLDKGWFSLGNVIQFQCGKLVIYASYFLLGVYAFSRRWFTRGNNLGSVWIWVLSCLVLFCATMFVLMKMRGSDLLIFRLAFVVFYPLLTLSFLGLFISFAITHLNRSTAITRSLADNSYNMYLTHYTVPMTLPLFLSMFSGMAVSVKFGLVSLVTVLLSYGISRYIIKPYVYAAVIGIGCVNIVLSMLT
jgi:glucans biosynthesis protein C